MDERELMDRRFVKCVIMSFIDIGWENKIHNPDESSKKHLLKALGLLLTYENSQEVIQAATKLIEMVEIHYNVVDAALFFDIIIGEDYYLSNERYSASKHIYQEMGN